MTYFPKKSLILFVIVGLFVVPILIFVISSFLGNQAPRTERDGDIPTPTNFQKKQTGTLLLTPLEKTTVGETTANELERSGIVINEIIRDDITIYQVRSASPGKTDEIRTRKGIVISERVDTFNKKAGMPPKLTTYQAEFGQPERVLDEVSPLGKHISAYIYARSGFTLFVNRYTNTVYQVHRFIPMTTEEYLKQYTDYIQPAPDYPRESFK